MGLLAALLLLMFSYIFCGLLVEAWLAVDEDNTPGNILLNVSQGVLVQALAVGVGDAFSRTMAGLAQHLPFSGMIPLGFRDHGKLWLALPLCALSLIVYDFFYYWFHRLQHISRWLWAEHELHHSDEHMNVSTGARHHYLELFLVPVLVIFPMGVFFQLPKVTVILAVFMKGILVSFIHLNAKIGFGPLNRVVTTPQVHRIHHSKLPQHLDKNFAATFPLWDVLFGTYYHPEPGEYPPTGVISGRTVHSLWEAAAMPFVTWARMLRVQPQAAQPEPMQHSALPQPN